MSGRGMEGIKNGGLRERARGGGVFDEERSVVGGEGNDHPS
jgi:hypothetical protein